jgi:hypothetical protein
MHAQPAHSMFMLSMLCLLCAGIALASAIGQSVGLALASFAVVGAVHMYTSYTSVRCVPLATLNPTRLQLLLGTYLGQGHQGRQLALQEVEGWQQQGKGWRQQQRQPHSAGEGVGRRRQQPEQEEAWWQLRQLPQEQQEPFLGGRLSIEGRVVQQLPTPSQMAWLEPIVASRGWHHAR